MSRNFFRSYSLVALKKASKKLLIFLCLFLNTHVYSQSYFYFESKLAITNNSLLTYYTFLTVETDGTASARIRYKNPVSGESLLIEQSFIDSSNTLITDTAEAEKKYLIPAGEAYYIEGSDDSDFVQPRFVFEKKTADKTSFYMPYALEYKSTGQSWNTAEMILIQQKSYEELTKQKEFVSYFYNEADNFYAYLFNLDTRSLNSVEQKTRLFLITVANTNDKKIGTTAQKDLDKITETFTTLTEKLGIILINQKISGTGFSKKAVDDAIDKWLTPTNIDIVVFYYSGHGFRYSFDVSIYPRISLRTSPDQKIDLNNLSIEEVYNRIVKKGARVNIVLSDCCNENFDAPPPIGRDLLKTKDVGTAGLKLNMDNCKALFFPNHPVSILTSAAEKNQLAVGNPELGGFFTNFFQAQLIKSLYSNQGESSWLRILLNAKESTRKQALTAPCNNARCIQRAEISVIPPL
jgi:Caspase domain